jgi:hypothetical protein
MREKKTAAKLAIIGLDGASWNIIDPMMKKGQLPHLSRLAGEGARGDLRSLSPMISTMLWTSISSGKLPDKHGVRDFAVSSQAVRCKRIWDILAEQDMTVGIYGHMITWPPEPVKGFMVPGSFAMGPETHPPDLSFLRKLTMDESSGEKRRLLEYMGYGWKALQKGVGFGTLGQMAGHFVRESLGRVDPLTDFFTKRLLKLRLDREVFGRLYRQHRPHLAYFYTHLIDSSQHLFWKYMEPDAFRDVADEDVVRYRDFIPQAYREADRTVGRIVSRLDENTAVLIVSDHGGEALSCDEEGFAVTIKTENLLKMMGLWEQVRAINIGFELYLCPLREDPELSEGVKRRFQEIVIEGTDIPVFQVTPIDYSYLQVLVEYSKVDRLKNAAIRVGQTVTTFEEIAEISLGKMSGCHHPHGICILWGPSVKAGARLEDAGLLDVTPTALMLMGLPVARDMDGRPLVEAAQESFLRAHPVTYVETYERQGDPSPEAGSDASMPPELMEKLKALGYLG